MFRRKLNKKTTPLDRRALDMMNQLTDFSYTLRDAVVSCLVKKGVIELYPFGPDRDAAQVEFEREKNHLLHAVAQYDDKRAQIISFLETYAGEFTCSFTKQSTSHEVVESEYERFWKK